MRSETFFEAHPVFTLHEFVAARSEASSNVNTVQNLLAKHVVGGRIVRVRRGLYATVPRGVEPARAQVDPFLLASQLAEDATISYHAALQFYGKSYSVWRRFLYLTDQRQRPFAFRGDEFVPARTPVAIRDLPDKGGGIQRVPHAGAWVRVTTLERTMVDALSSPQRCGGWEEIWRSLEMVEFFDVDAIVAYVLRLRSAVTAARVGYFLEQHRRELMVEESRLAELRSHAPRQPRYFDSARAVGSLVHGWNLVVPDDIAQRRWEESP
jgi:predicted transcriptional regulator of viral defense system